MLASAFMTVAVPKVAGVDRVVAWRPRTGAGASHPAMLHAMATSGADQIVCLGGVQALAAMAFGLAGIEPVDMLVGAGNAYVAEAKRQLFGTVGIDVLAGPTEVAIIADASADPVLVATDLLGQAEHGPTSPLCYERNARPGRDRGGGAAARTWPTPTWRARPGATRRGLVVGTGGGRLADARRRSTSRSTPRTRRYLSGLRNYGSLFLGAEATVAYGDKAVGTNHVLPTTGAARFTGGLWVGKFLKTCTYQRLTSEGTRAVAAAVAAISHAEQFAGHARTAEVRLAAATAP